MLICFKGTFQGAASRATIRASREGRMKSCHADALAILLGLLILLLPLTLLAKTALRPLSSYNWAGCVA